MLATFIGTLIFMLLYIYGKITVSQGEWSLQTAFGFGALFAALFGPIPGAVVLLIGYSLAEVLRYGSAWWSWVLAAAISGAVFGLSQKYFKVRQGMFSVKDALVFNLFQIIGNLAAWLLAAPVLDRLIYRIPYRQIIEQGLPAGFSQAITNILCSALIGTPLLYLYAASQAAKAPRCRQ